MPRRPRRSAAWLWAVVPPVAMACWGGSVQLRCFGALARYRGPVAFRVPSGASFVAVSAGAFQLDVRQRTLEARSLNLAGPDGAPIGSADRVRVKVGPDGWRPVRVTAAGVLARLERLPDGRWRNQELLPTEPTEPSDLPLEVRVESAVVSVVDRARREPLEIRAVLRNGRYLSHREAFWASGLVDAPGLSLRVEASSVRRGEWTADLGLERLEAIRWVRWLREGPERRWLEPLADWDARRAEASGTVHLRQGRRFEVAFEGELELGGVSLQRRPLAEQASFRGRIGTARAGGRLEARGSGWEAVGDWIALWEPRSEVAWDGVVRVQTPSALPQIVRRFVPGDVLWSDASFEGAARWVQDSGVFLNGAVQGASVAWDGWVGTEVRASLTADPAALRLDRLSLKTAGGEVVGRLAWRPGSGELAGRLTGTGIRAEPILGRWWREPPLRAVAKTEVLLGGTLAAPTANVRLQAYAGARLGDRWVDLGLVDLAAELRDGVLTVPRASSAGGLGLALASGQYKLHGGKLQGTVFLSGLEGPSWIPGLSGFGFARFSVDGSAASPVVQGRFEAFGLEYAGQSLPFLSADLRAAAKRLNVERAEAYRGTARLVARGSLDWSSGDVAATVDGSGIPAAELFGPGFSGELQEFHAALEGTIRQPKLRARAAATEIAFEGVRIQDASASLEADSERVRLGSLSGRVADGSISLKGAFDLRSGIGEAEGVLSAVPLSELSALAGPDIALGGTLGGSMRLAFDERGLVATEAEGTLSGVTVNGTAAGSGDWSVRGAGSVLSGSLVLGQLERFLEVSDLSLDLDRSSLSAKVQALGLPIEELWAAGRRALAPRLPSEDWVARMDQLKGRLTVSASIDGPWSAPNASVDPILLDSLTLGSEPMGSIRISGRRSAEGWEATEIRWEGGPGDLLANGRLTEDGQLELQGDLSSLDLSILNTLGFGLPPVQGRASVSFAARGPANEPLVDGSAVLQDFTAGGERLPLSVLLSSIRLDGTGLSFEGAVNYSNLTGPLSGSLPFTWEGGWDPARTMEVAVRIPERDVADVLPFLPALDPRRTSGRVSGRVALSGTVEEPQLHGSLRAELESLAASGLATTFRDASVELALGDGRASVTASAAGGTGGRIEAELGVAFGSLRGLIERGLEAWRSWTVEGRLRTDRLLVGESFGKGGRFSGVVDAELGAEGTLGRPRLSGRIVADSLEVAVPSEFAEGASPAELPIDPQLAITLQAARGARIKAPLAEVVGSGTGSVEGSLSRLRVAGTFSVSSGTLSLPNARVALDPDGVARLSYSGGLASDADVRVDVDLNGRASVTAMGPTGLYERYQLLLGFRGDLLSPEGLLITGQSDPPDLSPERIRAIIGQEDLVRTLETGDRRALASYALPVLFDAVTQDFARSVGLDFLGLDLGLAGEASLTAVRTFGGGWTLTFRRQVNETSGEPPIFDVRLNFRPPRRILPWPGFSLMLGSDQDRPWKVGVEYRRRL